MFISQVINGLVLPIVLIFMLLLINDPMVMREHTNGFLLNLVSWAIVIVLVVLSTVMVISGLLKT
jgi:Mn2+/Fe2+ NRAMP family transporter